MRTLVLKKFKDGTNHDKLIKKDTVYECSETRAEELAEKGLVKKISAEVKIKKEEPKIITNQKIETAAKDKKVVKPKSNKNVKKRPIHK